MVYLESLCWTDLLVLRSGYKYVFAWIVFSHALNHFLHDPLQWLPIPLIPAAVSVLKPRFTRASDHPSRFRRYLSHSPLPDMLFRFSDHLFLRRTLLLSSTPTPASLSLTPFSSVKSETSPLTLELVTPSPMVKWLLFFHRLLCKFLCCISLSYLSALLSLRLIQSVPNRRLLTRLVSVNRSLPSLLPQRRPSSRGFHLVLY